MFYILFGMVISQAYPIIKTPETVLKICALYYLYNIYQRFFFKVQYTLNCLTTGMTSDLQCEKSPLAVVWRKIRRGLNGSGQIISSALFKLPRSWNTPEHQCISSMHILSLTEENSDFSLLTSSTSCAKQLSMNHKGNLAGEKGWEDEVRD